jgi:hypothetical protein
MMTINKLANGNHNKLTLRYGSTMITASEQEKRRGKKTGNWGWIDFVETSEYLHRDQRW